MNSDQTTPINKSEKYIAKILDVEDNNKISNINVTTASEWNGIHNITIKEEAIDKEENEKEHYPDFLEDQPKVKKEKLDEDITESTTQNDFIFIKNEIQGIEIEHCSIKEECRITNEIDGKEHYCVNYWTPNICNLCEINVKTTTEDHINNYHMNGIFFNCPYCVSSRMLTKHRMTCELRKHRKILAIKCHYCGETCRNWLNTIAHIDEKHLDKAIRQCSICSYEAISYLHLINHKLCCHNGESLRLNCQFCNYSTVRSSLLQIHIEVKHSANIPQIETFEENPKISSASKSNKRGKVLKKSEPSKSLKISEPSKALGISVPSKALRISEPSKALEISAPSKALEISEPSSPWQTDDFLLKISVQPKGPWRWDCEESKNAAIGTRSPQKQMMDDSKNYAHTDYQNVIVKQEIIILEDDEPECQLGKNGYIGNRVGSHRSEPRIKREKFEEDEEIVEDASKNNFVIIKNEIPEEVEVKQEEPTDDSGIIAEDIYFCMKYKALNLCRLCDCLIYIELEKHVESHHKVGYFFNCPFCDCSKKFSKKTLSTEIMKHKKHYCVDCQFCGETFRYWMESINHIDQMHQREVSKCCCICGYQASSYKKLINHLLYLHDGETLKCNCEFCDFVTFRPSLLRLHAEMKHGIISTKTEINEVNT